MKLFKHFLAAICTIVVSIPGAWAGEPLSMFGVTMGEPLVRPPCNGKSPIEAPKGGCISLSATFAEAMDWKPSFPVKGQFHLMTLPMPMPQSFAPGLMVSVYDGVVQRIDIQVANSRPEDRDRVYETISGRYGQGERDYDQDGRYLAIWEIDGGMIMHREALSTVTMYSVDYYRNEVKAQAEKKSRETQF